MHVCTRNGIEAALHCMYIAHYFRKFDTRFVSAVSFDSQREGARRRRRMRCTARTSSYYV